eukprot:GHVO01045726.1.p1 GENE.GHVO01045726.1~~GHVO01045726.1.p1  ORF type:complete len:154 (+),score=28.13 GHVO01045726.1:118-579(+)
MEAYKTLYSVLSAEIKDCRASKPPLKHTMSYMAVKEYLDKLQEEEKRMETVEDVDEDKQIHLQETTIAIEDVLNEIMCTSTYGGEGSLRALRAISNHLLGKNETELMEDKFLVDLQKAIVTGRPQVKYSEEQTGHTHRDHDYYFIEESPREGT